MRSIILSVLVSASFLSSGFVLHAQPWHCDFGTTEDSCLLGVSGTLLSMLPAGTGRVRIGSQGGAVHLRNPGSPLLGAGCELELQAPTGGSLNKVQVHDWPAGFAATVQWQFVLSSGAGDTYAFVGNGGCFDGNGGFSSAEVFTGIRWRVDTAGVVSMALRSGTGWTDVIPSPISADSLHRIDLYCNNRTTASMYDQGGPNPLPAFSFDCWVDGILVADDAAKAGLPDTTGIDSFMLYAAYSPGNASILRVDDLHYQDEIADTPLPVELESFTVAWRAGTVVLDWRTATELNNHGFSVQRRVASEDWVTLGFVPGAGSSTAARAYRYRDSTTTRAATYHYRLLQRDRDGSSTTSHEVSVCVPAPAEGLRLGWPYPFPGRDMLFLPVQTDRPSSLRLSVTTLTGEQVAVFPARILPAGRHVLPLPCGAWPRGFLLCTIANDDAALIQPLLLQ